MSDFVKKAMKKAQEKALEGLRERWLTAVKVHCTSQSPMSVTIKGYTENELKELKMDGQDQTNETEELINSFCKLKKDEMVIAHSELLRGNFNNCDKISDLEETVSIRDRSLRNRTQDNLELKEKIDHMRKTINYVDDVLREIQNMAENRMTRVREIGEENNKPEFTGFFYHLAGFVQATSRQGLNQGNRDNDGY